MARIVVGVEAHKVRIEDARKDLFAHRQDSFFFFPGRSRRAENKKDVPVNLRGREGRMQEKSNFDAKLRIQGRAEHLWHEHEVVVVYPHRIVCLGDLCKKMCRQS